MASGYFDRMLFPILQQFVVLGQTILVLLDPLTGEFAELDFLENRLHGLLYVSIYDPRSASHVTVLRRFEVENLMPATPDRSSDQRY